MIAMNLNLILTMICLSGKCLIDIEALQQPFQTQKQQKSTGEVLSRRDVMAKSTVAGLATLVATSSSSVVAQAATTTNNKVDKSYKQRNLPNEQLASIVAADVTDRQFMVTGDFTRSIYDESATFQDEIDTYQMDPWIIGVKRLFLPAGSQIDLVPDSLTVTDRAVEFLFSEKLQFNLLLARPTLDLTGRLVLARDPTSGLITSYREYWDQDINTVLKTAKF